MESFYIFGVISLLVAVAGAADWGYEGEHGPDHWPDDYPACDGTHQSPIDITGAKYKDIEQIHFSEGYSQSSSEFTLSNNGHSAVVSVPESLHATIDKGGYGSTYKLAQFHFHWGADDTQGSEHTWKGDAFPLEVHFVHYNTRYPAIGDAVEETPDGLAVLGFFFEIGDHNDAFDNIINHLGDITLKDQEVTLDEMMLHSLLPSDLSKFYRYMGSLTTPGCFESVVWTVFDSTIEISAEQVAKFRELREGTSADDEKIAFNFREPQPINDRTLYSNNPDYDMGPKPPSAGATLPISLFTMVLLALAALLY